MVKKSGKNRGNYQQNREKFSIDTASTPAAPIKNPAFYYCTKTHKIELSLFVHVSYHFHIIFSQHFLVFLYRLLRNMHRLKL